MFHVNDKGNVRNCKARFRPCPYGAEAHFATSDAAHEYFEQTMTRARQARCRHVIDRVSLGATNEATGTCWKCGQRFSWSPGGAATAD